MEYELVTRPHQHRLLYEELEFNGGNPVVECSRCRLPLRPPAYSCSDSNCNFHIHQSCLHLPSYIRQSPFHPQHPIFKNEVRSHGFCSACGQSMSVFGIDAVYWCRRLCSFQLDIRCAIEVSESKKVSGFWRSDKYMHFRHPHPLSLSMDQDQQPPRSNVNIKKRICVMCEHLVESGSSFYFCSQSQCEDTHFHKQCAELLRVLENLHYHPHPLLLLFLYSKAESASICNSCRNICRGWVYTCPGCKFFLHLTCLQSFNHAHTFSNMFLNKIEFICTLCGQKCYDQFPWCCDNCHTLVHKKCTEFPSTLITTEHHHLLTLKYYFSPVDTGKIFCQICGQGMDIKYAGYACSTCNNFTAHLECCAQTQTHDYSAVDHHNLMNELDKINCDLILPEEYANLARNIKPISRLHPHPLTLISIHPHIVSQCDACFQHFNGLAYQCETCFSTFDVRCATLTNPFKHPNHQHPLYLCEGIHNHYRYCDACGKGRDDKTLGFRCSLCHFYLDISCATLPVELRYRFDPHALKLTYIEEKENRMGEYYCDICEEERDVGVWFYSCRECNYEAHPRCVLGEFPHVKSASHKSHNHPLNLQTLKLGKEADYKVAFQCGVCNFTLHANDEGNLTFINQNRFPRAIQLYDYHHHPIPKRHSGVRVILIGPFGDHHLPNMWKEWVFSTISAFAFFFDEKKMISGTQIQYEKNEKLVWSKVYGVPKGDKVEVSFDYPDEHLKTVYGTHLKEGSITSLILETNIKFYGHFGYEDGIRFSSSKLGVEPIGIFGSDFGSRIASIGFYGLSTAEE